MDSFSKATKQAVVFASPAAFKSRGAFSVLQIPVDQPLRVSNQPRKQCVSHRNLNTIPRGNLKAQSFDLTVKRGLQVAYGTVCLLPACGRGPQRKSTDFSGHGLCKALQSWLWVRLQNSKSPSNFKHKASQLSLTVRCATLRRNNNRKCHASQDIDNIQQSSLVSTGRVRQERVVHLQDWLFERKLSALSLSAFGLHANLTPRPERQMRELMLQSFCQSWLSGLFNASRTLGRKVSTGLGLCGLSGCKSSFLQARRSNKRKTKRTRTTNTPTVMLKVDISSVTVHQSGAILTKLRVQSFVWNVQSFTLFVVHSDPGCWKVQPYVMVVTLTCCRVSCKQLLSQSLLQRLKSVTRDFRKPLTKRVFINLHIFQRCFLWLWKVLGLSRLFNSRLRQS